MKIVHIETPPTKDHKTCSSSAETDVYRLKYVFVKIRGTETGGQFEVGSGPREKGSLFQGAVWPG